MFLNHDNRGSAKFQCGTNSAASSRDRLFASGARSRFRRGNMSQYFVSRDRGRGGRKKRPTRRHALVRFSLGPSLGAFATAQSATFSNRLCLSRRDRNTTPIRPTGVVPRRRQGHLIFSRRHRAGSRPPMIELRCTRWVALGVRYHRDRFCLH